MTRLLPVLAVLVACTTSTPVPEAAPAGPPPGDPPPVPAEDVGDGVVQVSARVLPPGQPLEVAFVRPGKSGCYRQTAPETTFGDHTVTHTYTTSVEPGSCTAALVPGGFRTKVTFPSPGTWQGRILVDGEEVGVYFVDVGGT